MPTSFSFNFSFAASDGYVIPTISETKTFVPEQETAETWHSTMCTLVVDFLKLFVETLTKYSVHHYHYTVGS